MCNTWFHLNAAPTSWRCRSAWLRSSLLVFTTATPAPSEAPSPACAWSRPLSKDASRCQPGFADVSYCPGGDSLRLHAPGTPRHVAMGPFPYGPPPFLPSTIPPTRSCGTSCFYGPPPPLPPSARDSLNDTQRWDSFSLLPGRVVCFPLRCVDRLSDIYGRRHCQFSAFLEGCLFSAYL